MESKSETEQKQEILKRIARYLMLHSSHLTNIGLLDGKMGIALFFYHYARYTHKKIYEDFGGELIDEIYGEIHDNTPVNFKYGLCGIAWGIEYLIQGNFVQADSDEVLEELDKRNVERDVRRIEDTSMETGLKGIAYYVISRLANKGSYSRFITEDYVIDLINALDAKKTSDTENKLLQNNLKDILNHQLPVDIPNLLSDIIGRTSYKEKKIFTNVRPLGIADNGYAGIGLKLITEEGL